jgi:hypothetical protein
MPVHAMKVETETGAEKIMAVAIAHVMIESTTIEGGTGERTGAAETERAGERIRMGTEGETAVAIASIVLTKTVRAGRRRRDPPLHQLQMLAMARP